MYRQDLPLHRSIATRATPIEASIMCACLLLTQSTFPMIRATEKVNCGIGSDCCDNKRFIVLLSRCPLSCFDKPNSIEYTYLKRLDEALESKDQLELDTTIEEISGLVATLCQRIFKEFASIIGDESQVLDLGSCINPETYKLQLITLNGKPKVIRCNSNGRGIIRSTLFGLPVRTAAANLDLPKFPPKQVKVLEQAS